MTRCTCTPTETCARCETAIARAEFEARYGTGEDRDGDL